MAAHYCFVPVESLGEVKRARHKISCLLKEMKEQDLRMQDVVAQKNELQEENRILKYGKVYYIWWHAVHSWAMAICCIVTCTLSGWFQCMFAFITETTFEYSQGENQCFGQKRQLLCECAYVGVLLCAFCPIISDSVLLSCIVGETWAGARRDGRQRKDNGDCIACIWYIHDTCSNLVIHR